VRLGDLLTFLTSGSRGWAKYYRPKGEVFLRIENVGRNELILENLTFVDAPATVEAKRIKVQGGDILLSITADLGRTCVIPKSFPIAYVNQHLAILRVKDVLPLYLSAFIASEGGASQIRRLDRQGVKSGLNFDDIRSIDVMLPPVECQERFVAQVKKVESLRAKQGESEKELDNLFNSLMQKAFKGELFS
jgi:type I restriction enzyme S subunit